jgi:two-component sensor histidine kinase
MMLDIESITPIGLILNELITNVLKHAFDSLDSERQLDIAFKKEGEELVLKVIDNGRGMPDDVRESSFGIKLMKALAKKLKATIQFEDAPVKGTVATLNVSRYNLLS